MTTCLTLPPLMTWDRREGCGVPAFTATELSYARLLYRSGYPVTTIAAGLGQTAVMLTQVARRAGWTRGTPFRSDAPAPGIRVPVVARCSECLARFGEARGTPRPCPRCGSALRGAPAQLELIDLTEDIA